MDPLRACSFQEPASLMPNRANASQLKIAIGNGGSASGLINLRKEKKKCSAATVRSKVEYMK